LAWPAGGRRRGGVAAHTPTGGIRLVGSGAPCPPPLPRRCVAGAARRRSGTRPPALPLLPPLLRGRAPLSNLACSGGASAACAPPVWPPRRQRGAAGRRAGRGGRRHRRPLYARALSGTLPQRHPPSTPCTTPLVPSLRQPRCHRPSGPPPPPSSTRPLPARPCHPLGRGRPRAPSAWRHGGGRRPLPPPLPSCLP